MSFSQLQQPLIPYRFTRPFLMLEKRTSLFVFRSYVQPSLILKKWPKMIMDEVVENELRINPKMDMVNDV